MKYTRKHHSSWVQFAEDKGHGAVNPILVTGTDLTLDFAMLAYASLGRSVDVKFSAEATGIASLQASVWGKWAFNGSVHHTCGPQVTAAPGYIPQGNALLEFPDTEDVRPMFDQCVFVRGFRIRKRLGFFPQVMNAAAEAVDLDGDSSDHDASAGGALVASEALDVDSAYVVDDDMPPDIDPLDCIAHYIFKNSDASTCILHDDDCTALIKDSDLQPGESLGDFLARQKPKVTVDADGVASVYLPDKEFAPDSSKVPVVEPITDKATALNSPVSVTLPPGLSRNLLATVFKTVDHSSGSLYAVKIRKRSHFRRGPKLDRAPDEVVLQRLRGRRMDEIQTIFSNDESISTYPIARGLLRF
ncbi:hypothetical protein PLICRDRAFT_463353 [Plicaturopsis crispa FD-325 SS-3]|nr:hypothetical protein PLICRDRAFT_463353 [Plicaturopsis crispa FD-325 SS-3]